MRSVVRLLPSFVVAVTITAVAACGVGRDRDPNATTTTAAVASGADLAKSFGCAACHGPNGEGGTGPAWVGLYGSEVTLKDGSTVVVDEAYLRRSIVDPNAQVPAGSNLPMPLNTALTPDDIDVLVEYIKSLGG